MRKVAAGVMALVCDGLRWLWLTLRPTSAVEAENLFLRRQLALYSAADLRDLLIPPSNFLEAMKGDRKGQHSIRINKQWRLCFKWKDGDAFDVEIVDYH